MSKAQTLGHMSPKILRVMQRAKEDPNAQFNSLAHLMDEDALKRAFASIRKGAAAGVDGVSKSVFGEHLQENITQLHAEMRSMRYRHQPIRRVHIPKGKGKTRPIGIPTVRDKIVQKALTETLNLVYEPIFLDCSHGYRPGRNAHDAIRALNEAIHTGRMHWILEADIESFFDSVDHNMLREILQERVVDGSMLRLIGKCLKAGVLDGERLRSPEEGTAQGSSLSPLLANIYLHHVLDQWFDQQVKPRMKGHTQMVRYADDLVICFEHENDARKVYEVLEKRLARFGLRLNLEKTRLFRMGRPPHSQQSGKGESTFDFLGFTVYWRRSRKGRWMISFKTRRASLRRIVRNLYEWCRRQRHRPIKEQHATLVRKMQGHFNYFGVNGNMYCLQKVPERARKIWLKWLKRRGQRTRLNWERFGDLLKDFPLPRPRIKIQIWKALT